MTPRHKTNDASERTTQRIRVILMAKIDQYVAPLLSSNRKEEDRAAYLFGQMSGPFPEDRYQREHGSNPTIQPPAISTNPS
jgi:hypothetical protein